MIISLPPSTHKTQRLSHSTMSTPNVTSTTSNRLEAIFNAALVEYTNQTGKDLRNHPLASKIDACDSAEAILDIFQAQAKTFDEFRKGSPKLIKWLQSLVTNLYDLSTNPILITTVSLVSATKILCFLTVFFLMPTVV